MTMFDPDGPSRGRGPERPLRRARRPRRASDYLREHGGWDIESGSNDLMTVMLLVLGCRPGALRSPCCGRERRNLDGDAADVDRLDAGVLLVALLFTWRVIVVCRPVDRAASARPSPPSRTSRRSSPRTRTRSIAYDYRVPDRGLLAIVRVPQRQQRRDDRLRLAALRAGDPGPRHPRHRLPGGGGGGVRGHTRPGGSSRTADGADRLVLLRARFARTSTTGSTPSTARTSGSASGTPSRVEDVLLVPDFDAYRDLTPSRCSGIDTQFVYGGWDPLSSEFSYELVDYNTDFGLGDYGLCGAPDPELYLQPLGRARFPRPDAGAPRAGERDRHPPLLLAAADGP